MNELQTLTYKNRQIRTVQRDGETWWVLKDVCEVLCINNTTDVANRLEADEKATFDLIESLRKDTVFVTESGLYNVILRSDKPEAKAFKRWVTHEVLPSIRKTGAYIATPKTYLEALEALVISEKEKLALQAENSEMKPKAAFADLAMKSKDVLSINDAAKVLKLGYGNITLFKKLRDMGILMDGQEYNVPYQRYIAAGYFRVDESPLMIGDSIQIKRVTKGAQT
jgi:anti-repressor protein